MGGVHLKEAASIVEQIEILLRDYHWMKKEVGRLQNCLGAGAYLDEVALFPKFFVVRRLVVVLQRLEKMEQKYSLTVTQLVLITGSKLNSLIKPRKVEQLRVAILSHFNNWKMGSTH
jgi:hypothetical protein